LTWSELRRLIEGAGWVVWKQNGAVVKFRHPTRPGTIVLHYHATKQVAPGTLHTILKQAGLK